MPCPDDHQQAIAWPRDALEVGKDAQIAAVPRHDIVDARILGARADLEPAGEVLAMASEAGFLGIQCEQGLS